MAKPLTAAVWGVKVGEVRWHAARNRGPEVTMEHETPLIIRLDGAEDTWAEFDPAGCLLGWGQADLAWQPACPTPAWSLLLREGSAERRAGPLGPGTASAVSASGVSFTFTAVQVGAAPVPLRVIVNWQLAEGLLQGRIALSELPAGTEVHAVLLPDLALAYTDPRATALVVPWDTGWLISEAALALAESQGPRPGLRFDHPPLQCQAWLEGERGCYLETRDDSGWLREWAFVAEAPGRVRLHCAHLLPRPLPPPGAFTLPYPVGLGAFRGGWYEVAQWYRRWALTAPWAQRGPEQRRGSFVADLACWVWNRGPAATVIPPARELARRIGAPVGLDWYWWHQHGYDTEYPAYFPPREGTETFKAAIREAQAANLRVQVYINGMCYDVDGQAWLPEGPECALMQEDGTWFAPAYNTFTQHHLASVCGAAPRWRPILLNLVRQAHALGLDGLYLDMIGAVGGRRACYHPRHPHLAGGGDYGVQGFRATLRELRAAVPAWPLSTESAQEWYLDLFESHIICGVSLERLKWQAEFGGGRVRVVPLFTAVYHGRTVNFGNYSFLDGVPPFDELWPPQFRRDPALEPDWVARCPDQFALELARTVTFGLQPLVSNLRTEHLSDPRLAADLAFLVRLARVFHRQREFLLWGTMLAPGTLSCPEHETVFLQRFVFTAPGEESYLRRRFPALMHSAWQAPDGRRALLLVNYARDPVAFSFQPAAGWMLAPTPAAWAEPPPGAGDLCFAAGGVSGQLPPRAVCMLPLIPGG